MRKYKLIGLTGQTGAGKSSLSDCFRQLGVAVVNADGIVAELYKSGSVCLRAVSSAFGEEILNANGSLNRAILAKKAFSSKENTALLGRLVHPFVTAEIFAMLKTDEMQSRDIIVYDAPQLFESNFDCVCDYVVSVTAEEKIRLKRIMERDGLGESDARQRMNAQLDESFFKRNSDFIIENNGGISELYEKAADVLEAIRG